METDQEAIPPDELQNKVDSEGQEFLQDLLRVGTEKPLGYLPIQTLTEDCKTTVEAVSAVLRKRGVHTLLLSDAESGVYSGALYAFHAPSLRKLLDENEDVLRHVGWPVKPEMFIRFLRVTAPNQAIRSLIAQAFGDKSVSTLKIGPPNKN